MGEGIVRESGMDMDTLLYLTWRTSKDLLDSTGNSARCRGVWALVYISLYISEHRHCVHVAAYPK